MRLQIVGSSGTYPAPGRPCAGYLIEQKGFSVLCDAGPGTFMSLPIDPDTIQAVVISHQHVDHCADLFAAFHAWTYRPEPREGVPVYAPESAIEHILAFVDGGQGDAIHRTLDFRPVSGGDEVEIGPFTVRFADMFHPVPCVGSRWEADGRVLFYTGDTGPGGEWHETARDADLMLAEAAFQEPPASGDAIHLTAAEAGRIARRLGVKRLVLTHIPPYMDASRSVHEAETAFGRPVALAVPGVGFDV